MDTVRLRREVAGLTAEREGAQKHVQLIGNSTAMERLRDMVGKGVGLPVVLENDANAAAYGEYVSGAGKDADDLVVKTWSEH